MAKSDLSMLEKGFQNIDNALAINDPATARMVDEVLSKMSVAMSRRTGINPQALQQFARELITARSAATLKEESTARRSKMAAAAQLGGAERQYQLNIAGLEAQNEAFRRKLVTRYVGAALSAGGALLGQAIASGMFKDKQTDVVNNPDDSFPTAENRDQDAFDKIKDMMKPTAQREAPSERYKKLIAQGQEGTRGPESTFPQESFGVSIGQEPSVAALQQLADKAPQPTPTFSGAMPANERAALRGLTAQQAASLNPRDDDDEHERLFRALAR